MGVFDERLDPWIGAHQTHQLHRFLDEGLLIACSAVPPGMLAIGLPGLGREHAARMREYNRRFRGHDAPTDVLSFACDPFPGVDGEPHLGDIVISVPAAERQARQARHGLGRELKILALHGYLHLLGYDHETDDGTMRRVERSLRGRLLRGRDA